MVVSIVQLIHTISLKYICTHYTLTLFVLDSIDRKLAPAACM